MILQLKLHSVSNTEWKDLLTNYNGTAITYDTIGNPLNWTNGKTFTWTAGRQLSGVTDANNTIAYTYDDSGIRTSKTVNGTKTDYYLNGTAIIMQKTGDQCIWYTYDESGNLSGLRVGNSEYYYYRNGQGDIIGIIDGTGSIAAKYSYDAWGTPIAITDGAGNDVSGNAAHIANINPFRYRGYFYDVETGLYYLQSRYYDPQVGRFVNADGYVSGTGKSIHGYNLFTYCDNNPVNKLDSTGNWPKWIKDVANTVSNVIKKVSSAISNIVKTEKASISVANNVSKTHVTTPKAMLDLGILFGKVGFSSTVTKQNKELGLVHSYSDIGNDASKYAAGINVVGWLGVDIGVSSEINVFVSAQVTPWIHGEVSVGLDGIGAVVGFDVGDTSYDFEINGGWGLIAIFVVPQIVSSYGGAPISAPA